MNTVEGAAQVTSQDPRQLAAAAIRSTILSPSRSLGLDEWSKIEQFATGKAREYRSAQLKRSASAASGPSAQSSQPRRFVKVRKQKKDPSSPCYSVTKSEFEEYKRFQRGEVDPETGERAGLPEWFQVDDQKGLEIMHNYQDLSQLYGNSN